MVVGSHGFLKELSEKHMMSKIIVLIPLVNILENTINSSIFNVLFVYCHKIRK